MNSSHYYAVSALFNGLFGAFIVYTIYLRNKTNPINRSFVYFGIAVTGWSLIYSLWAWASDPASAETYVRRHMMFEAFIPATFFHFACHFTKSYEKMKKAVIVFYALGAFYSMGMLTPLMIAGVKNVLFFKYWPVPGPFLLSHVVYFFIVICSAFWILIRRVFATSGAERSQAWWVTLAILTGFGGGSFNWFLWFDVPIPPMTNFFVGIMFTIMAYAMVRYGVMDADTVVEILRSSKAATLGLMASMINHDLRNPLYIAKSRAEIYQDRVENGGFNSKEEEILAARESLKSIQTQLSRAMDIMQRFSDFARPSEADRKEKIVLDELWNEVICLVSREIELSKIKIQRQPARSDLSVVAQRGQMEEIFFNLIMNACHSMEKGGELRLSACQPNGKILVEVEDTGTGIPKENQRRIFEPFYSTKGRKGTGLGLYIVKQLVERNGGKISVHSRPGRGTKFKLELQGA